MPKNVQTTTQLHSFYMLAMNAQNPPSREPPSRLNSMWNENFQMYKLDLEKAEESEIKRPTSVES